MKVDTETLLLPESGRVSSLLKALGIEQESFNRVLEWALCEHIVSSLVGLPEIDKTYFARPDALKRFRSLLRNRTGRDWSAHDLGALFERVKAEKSTHFRRPVPYEEYLKLLWQVPLVCIKCGRRPPEVVLHVDHIVPASRGGHSKRPNLQFLCSEENLMKSNSREVTGPWLDLL
jgi:5-methylcytosine-specific restriction endonuclease McrA